MHLPDHLLSQSVSVASGILALAGVGGSLWSLTTAPSADAKQLPTRFWPSLAAGVFALQMLNYPISQETSGHVLGAASLAIMVGPRVATLLMAVVITLQAILFADGGLTALGANILNMGLLAVWTAHGLWTMTARWSNSLLGQALRAIIAGWCSVQVAALGCTTELFLSQSLDVAFAKEMFVTHAWIGWGDAVLALCAVISLQVASHKLSVRSSLILTVALIAVALMIAPFAAETPDGLEWSMQQAKLTVADSTPLAWQWSDYQVPALGEVWYSTCLAGLLGVMMTGGVVMLLKKCGSMRVVGVE
jgi:cobalt/nickel transport system permease protein